MVYVGTPAAIAHPRLEPPLEGRRVSTNTENGYCHLVFDENQVVQSFVYAGPHQINGAKYQVCLLRVPRVLFLTADE